MHKFAQKRKPLSQTRSGQMPFALIAVTLLLLGSAYGVVYASIERSEDNTDSITGELMSVGDGIDDTKKYIEAGLGNIISDLSKAETGGTLVQRIANFDPKLDEWMSSNFPLRDRGITATVSDYDIDLSVETLKLSSGDVMTDGSKASFLRASGQATIQYVTSTGTTVKTLDISADGISGLPFVTESATRFELSASGEVSVLTQLMAYQLSTLAQYRVINGYGAVSESGDNGTRAILTSEDVNESFRSSLSIIETLCFRCTSDNIEDMETAEHVDAADLLIIDNGQYKIDLSMVFSQAMLSLLDAILLRWMDLFFGEFIFGVIDGIADAVRDVCEFIGSFFGGGSKDTSARPYIESVMKGHGYDESEYRYFTGDDYTIIIPSGTFILEDGTETEYDAFAIDIEHPYVDVISWGGWNNFVDRYHEERNDTIEYMRSVLHKVAMNIGSGYGSISIDADSYDGTTFSDSFSSSIEYALNDGWDKITREMSNSIRSDTITDPMFVAIFDDMEKNIESIFKEKEFDDSLNGIVEKAIEEHIANEYGEPADGLLAKRISASKDVTVQIDAVKDDYRSDVNGFVNRYEDVLTDIPKSNDSMFKNTLIWTLTSALEGVDLIPTVKAMTNSMCQTISEHLKMNSRYGLTELDGEDSFMLYDGDGNTHEEMMNIAETYTTNVNITQPTNNTSKCYHTVGFEDYSLTPYTTVFTVAFSAEVEYDAVSSSAILNALGTYDSKYKGIFEIDTKFDVPCVSGWALAGVTYPPSSNIINELWNQLLKALDPILEPLREIYGVIQDLFDACSTAIVEISAYITDLIMKFYEAIEGPLEAIQDFVDGCVMDAIGNFVEGFNIGLGSQSITFAFLGLTVTIETKLLSLLKTTKNIVKATVVGYVGDTKFSAFAEIKKNTKGYMLRGGGGVEGDDWNIDLTVDPLLKFGNTMVSAEGTIRNVDFSASLPTVVQYNEAELKVSDIPGIGTILSNIPLPIPGVKGSIDMGVELKYDIPMDTGLMINEFETNPKGSDNGAEWVELYNASSKEISLSGYMLVPGTSDSKAMIIVGEKIPAWGKTVITFEKQCLNNSKSGKYNGERLTLYDPEGNKIDETPWKKDSYNNDNTWQRSTDGASKWEFLEGTPEGKNGGTIKTSAFAKEFLIDSFFEAGCDAFEKVGNLTSVDDIAAYLKKVLELFIENVIEKIADCLISASVFISLELTDYAETQHGGVRVSLEMNSDLVEDGIKWLLSQTGLLGSFLNAPECSDPLNIVCENTYFRTMVYAGISAPKFLSNATGTSVTVGLSAAVNVSGICDLFGAECGKWKAEIGVVIEDIPSAFLPKGLKGGEGKSCDLWLLKMVFSEH